MARSKLHQDKRHKHQDTTQANSRLMEQRGEKRSGSDSNAQSARKQSRLHESHKDRQKPLYPDTQADFDRDLRPHNMAGANIGQNQTLQVGARPANELKELHARLADLTDDELQQLIILPEGTRLQQGARYIDLRHLENGEFVATSEMVAGPANLYVPKKETDYVLWNRLNQVTEPERLDESESSGNNRNV